MKNRYKNKNVCVVGLGKTGLSCVDFLVSKQANVRVTDSRNQPPCRDQLDKSVPLHCGGINSQWLAESEMIVVSPGVSLKIPEIQNALSQGIEIVGDIELFCREADKPIVAITGSNGKSTVTTLVTKMAQAAGLNVGMGGNIGIPALSLLNNNADLYVLELSSFQLETTLSLRATAATVLNVTEDHMDRYDNLEQYRRAKLKIYRHCQVGVFNEEDPLTREEVQSAVKMVGFSEKNADYCIKFENEIAFFSAGGEKVMNCHEMPLAGRHNSMNVLAAVALAQAVGIGLSPIRDALRNFNGLDHRFQTICVKNGVRWINDSKATNPGSTIAALTGLKVEGTLHLLLGGDGKGADFLPLVPLINQPNVVCYCFGRDGAILAKLANNSVVFDTLSEAVEYLRPTLHCGDMVLLSPACASLDQFRSFEERGEVFSQLARM